MKDLKKIQKQRDAEPVWVTWVNWSDGSWGACPDFGTGTTRRYAMEDAKKYFSEHNILWAQGMRTKYGFSNRIKFRKYFLGKETKGRMK